MYVKTVNHVNVRRTKTQTWERGSHQKRRKNKTNADFSRVGTFVKYTARDVQFSWRSLHPRFGERRRVFMSCTSGGSGTSHSKHGLPEMGCWSDWAPFLAVEKMKVWREKTKSVQNAHVVWPKKVAERKNASIFQNGLPHFYNCGFRHLRHDGKNKLWAIFGNGILKMGWSTVQDERLTWWWQVVKSSSNERTYVFVRM